MGIFSFLKKQNVNDKNITQVLTPDSFSSNIAGQYMYGSDIVVQSIRCKSNEFKKLKPQHIRVREGERTVVNSSISRVLKYPNEYMTQSDFLEKITILLELNKNVYIFPRYHYDTTGARIYEALYPLKPATVEMLQDNSNKYFYKFTFDTGYTVTLSTDDIIHWKKDYGVNDFFGGNGDQDTRNLYSAISYYDSLCKNIAKALNSSYQINGLLKVNTMLSNEKMEQERQAFINRLQRNESGIMVTDLKTEYIDMKKDVKLIDADTMKFMYDNVIRANGTSLAILSGDYTKAQKEAYYEHALESDIKSLGEAFSKTLFTQREKDMGNEVIFYPREINFMSMENKIAFSQVALPAGVLTKNEFRELFGYGPLPNGEGEKISQGYNTIINPQEEGEKNEERN